MGRAGLMTCAWYGAVFLAFGAHLPYWPVWLADWGLSEAEVGAYFGLAMAVRIAGATLLPALTDRYAVRRAAVGGAALAAGAVLLAHLGITTRPVLLAATLAASFAMAPLIPIGEALGLRAAATHGFAYSHARAVGSLAFLVMNLGLGAAIAWFGAGVVPWTVALCFLATAGFGLVHPGGGAPPGAGHDRARWREALALLTQPVFLTFALAASIGQASHAVYYAYGTLTWLGQGIGSGMVGALWAVAVTAEILLMFGPGRAWVARLGPARALVLGSAAGVLRWGLMSQEPPLMLLWPVQALHALTFALAHLGAMAFVAAAVPPRLQASAQGLYGGGMGAAAIALASLGASAIGAEAGIAAAYWLAAAMAAVALGAALWLGRIWDGGLVAPDHT